MAVQITIEAVLQPFMGGKRERPSNRTMSNYENVAELLRGSLDRYAACTSPNAYLPGNDGPVGAVAQL